jgi:transcriptional regulator with XRE-family HTH domain
MFLGYVGARLARLRRERGMTQVELAERLGVSQPIVSDYERGELRLHGELIVRLTEILRVSAEELLGLEPARAAAMLSCVSRSKTADKHVQQPSR